VPLTVRKRWTVTASTWSRSQPTTGRALDRSQVGRWQAERQPDEEKTAMPNRLQCRTVMPISVSPILARTLLTVFCSGRCLAVTRPAVRTHVAAPIFGQVHTSR
jgi:hypothetical protein